MTELFGPHVWLLVVTLMALSTQELIQSYPQKQIYADREMIAKVLLHRCLPGMAPDKAADDFYLKVLRREHGAHSSP